MHLYSYQVWLLIALSSIIISILRLRKFKIDRLIVEIIQHLATFLAKGHINMKSKWLLSLWCLTSIVISNFFAIHCIQNNEVDNELYFLHEVP